MKKLIFAILVAVAFTGCFSPWNGGDQAKITLVLAGSTEQDRAVFPPEESMYGDFEHTVILSNGTNTLTFYAKGGTTIEAVVAPGLWDITVHTYLNGEAYATGSATVDLQPGNENVIRITMFPASGTVVPGANLAEKLAWLKNNAKDNGEYLIVVDKDEIIGPQDLNYSGKNVSITIKGDITGRKINLSGNGSLFKINSGVALTLENITLQGHDSNDSSLVYVDSGSNLVMNTKSKISDNTIGAAREYGGGVYVFGTFTMNSGEISDNFAMSGGGVYVGEGIFIMHGGEISNNIVATSNQFGGGVYVGIHGTFIMKGGEIFGNTYDINSGSNKYGSGGGVYVSGFGTFRISTGTIYGSDAGDKSNVAIGGAALCKEDNGTAQYGTFTGNTWNSNGNLDTTDNTIRVENGVLLSGSKLLEITMIQIEGGVFTMGSPENEPGRYDNETQHQVTLSGFFISDTPVTQAQYQAVMGNNPSDFTSSSGGDNPANRPVERVSWYDALVFCNKLSINESLSPAYSINGSTDPAAWGTVPTDLNATWDAVQIVAGSNGYRLPTEAQWEYACRAGKSTAFNWGTDYIDDSQANYDAKGVYDNNTVAGTYLQRTTEVETYAPNAWGLYDMHGNVFEWCWDWYGEEYEIDAQTNPTGAVSGDARVARGGSWAVYGRYLRSAFRGDGDPYGRFIYVGFRLVCPAQ